MFSLNENDIYFIPIITGIVNILKNLGLKNNFAPLVSLVLGIIFSVFFSPDALIKYRVLKGIILGLSASGFYTSGKRVITTVKSNGTEDKK